MFSASIRAASAPARRLSQVQRHFATASNSFRDAYILSAVRTPTGKFQGGLKDVPATQLGATAIREAVARSKVPVERIEEVYMGAVLQGGMGQAPARQAMIFADIPEATEAITINKVCSSGLKAVVFAAQNIQMGHTSAAVAGGMENMSSVPRYVSRTAGPYGDIKAEDGIIKDGLWDVYNQFHMGNCAENTAKNLNITREEQDKYAIESYRRAKEAWEAKSFEEEIVPVTIKQRKGEVVVSRDEDYETVKLDKVPTLKPAFQKDGTVTAANASTLNDGASALVLGNAEIAKEFGNGSKVLAKIISYADAAVAPVDFPIAPAKAIPIALERAGLKKEDIAVWEINEAFAAVSKAIEKTLQLDASKVNKKGGAIALGHALGSSGSRILTTLLYQLKAGEYGVAAICNGGGGATAMVVQRVDNVD